MATLQIRRNFQITLPVEVRKKVGCQVGDFIEAEVEVSMVGLIWPLRVASYLAIFLFERPPNLFL